MKRILLGLVGVVLALAVSFGVAVPQASAHNSSGTALYNCAATRVSEEHTIQHAHWVVSGTYSNGVSYKRYTCASIAEDLQCFWVVEMQTWAGVSHTFVFSGPNCAIVG